ncbi:rhodanese-like domain-containing protein [Phaeovulum sp. NW3]|uniref:sulfurtransferase n=1 Tax=Phaeovulum sp. NW3 TaxID=2934933 RepID=UPI002020BD31|nr:rhodanese-like domain-containing protein [Phaeovulum sp. NW3]MCL7466091.1 rhodanese-like domain-containing protein [Phaeovulum sp. NW3]
MHINPLVNDADLAALGPLRLIYVPAADERPQGMLNVPIEEWVETAKRSPSGLDDLAYWQREFEALGVAKDTVSVVLDDGRMTEAARVWFMLQYFGLPTTVLNGGIAALSTLPPQAGRATVSLQLSPGSGVVGLAERTGLKADLPDVQVFDARTIQEHAGVDLKGNARGGHLPGAALLAHGDLLDGRHLKPAGEIAQMMDQAGIDGSKPVVTHCNGGGRAALAALAAVVAGRGDVRVYYLSFADWAADESCPIHLPD